MSNGMTDGIAHGKGNSLSPEPCALIPCRSPQSQSSSTREGGLTRGEVWLLVVAGLSEFERMGIPKPGRRRRGSKRVLALTSPEMKNLQGWFSKFIREDEAGCWIWHGARFKSGYGACGFRGSTNGAHRAIWQILRGDLPRSLDLDHLCRVRACVNPDHLEPVTRSINLTRGAHPVQGVLGRSA